MSFTITSSANQFGARHCRVEIACDCFFDILAEFVERVRFKLPAKPLTPSQKAQVNVGSSYATIPHPSSAFSLAQSPGDLPLGLSLGFDKSDHGQFDQTDQCAQWQGKPQSNSRRIQRFFAEFKLPKAWATGVILHLLPVKSDFVLPLDRTQWQVGKVPINLLTIGILYQGMAFLIGFKMLNKKGNANTQERIDLMKRVCQYIRTSEIRAWVAG